MGRANSVEKTLILGKTEGKRLRWLDSIMDSRNVSLSKLWKIVEDRGAWRAAVLGVTKSWTQLSDWTTTASTKTGGWMQNIQTVGIAMLLHVGEGKWSGFSQSCPTLCDPMDCSLPGFSVHWIFQARVLEWVAIKRDKAQEIWRWLYFLV